MSLVTKIFKPKKALTLLFLLSSILLATLIQTNKIWKNQYTLWTNTLMREGGARAYLDYGLTSVPYDKPEIKEKYFRKALEKDPSYIYAHMQYGKILIQANQYKRGLYHLELVTKIKPSSPGAHFYLSKGLHAKGDLKLALISAEKASNLAKRSLEYKNW